ncbi:hypothetical protein M9H77_14539 [Catharanthus roseus]|uniref:Uncharacterized protein n=1 Tax=Catharanthus roseus TaxID=4058 RepID=A0ACC0BNI0_CATRO|nr:hypothetical protein M9H77_14539 [Catharanthus roseus]
MSDMSDGDPGNTPVKRKTEEEAAATSTTMPDDLALMVIVGGGMIRGRVYGAGSERVETTISSVSDAFDEYMRRFTEQNHLVYIPPPTILDLVRASMGTDASTSLLPAPDVDSEVLALDVSVRSSSTPSPSIHVPGTDDAPALQ